MPTFSVVIPTFNSARYISETVESVLKQTFRDFEIVVVDDGSTDETMDILSGFKEVKLFTQSHGERARARNRGIKEACGKYISFLDADDVWLSNKLKDDFECFKKYKDAGIVCSDIWVINEAGKRIGKRSFSGRIRNIKTSILYSNLLFTSAVSVRREVFEKSGYFCEETKLSGSEDWEMWARLSRDFAFIYNLQINVQYRQHAVSERLAASIERSALMASSMIIREMPRQYSNLARRITANTHSTIALNYAACLNKKKVFEHIKLSLSSDLCALFNNHLIFAMLRTVFPKKRPASVLRPGDGIAMVITVFDGAGGIQKQAKLLSEEFSDMGFKVYILARNYFGLPAKMQAGNLHIRRFVFSPRHRIASSLYYLCASLFWLVINRKKFKVIHCFQLAAPLNVGVLAKLLIGKPVVVRLSGTGELGDVHEIKKLVFNSLRIFLLRFVDRFIVLNNLMQKELKSLLGPDRDRKVCYIPNSVRIESEGSFDEPTRQTYREKLKLDYPYIATYVGRLTVGKGLYELILAWKNITVSHPSAHLFLVGKGGLFLNIESDLRSLAERLGVNDNVHFIGEVSTVRDYLLASNIFVSPTVSEGMSNAILEAMSCGNIIITTAIPANLNLLDESSAIFVSPDNSEQLSDAISRVLGSPEAYYQLARRAQDKVNLYSVELIAERYLRLYAEVL